MKKILMLMVLLLVTACGKKQEEGITLNLKGDLPSVGEVKVDVYGYDKMLADHKATLIVIHREKLTEDRRVEIDLPEDAEKIIEPPVRDAKGASYYVNIEVAGEEDTYTQDYDKNAFIEIEEGIELDIYMKKQ